MYCKFSSYWRKTVCVAAHLDVLLLLLEELVHLGSSLLLTEGSLCHNVQLFLQRNIVSPGLLKSTTHKHTHRQKQKSDSLE